MNSLTCILSGGGFPYVFGWLSWLSPWLGLWGLAALIPIAIHLWFPIPSQTVRWSAMQFLRQEHGRSVRRNQIMQWLLLILRVLALLMLGMAVARPLLVGRNQVVVQSGLTVVVVDNSYSMNYIRGQQPVWEEAIQVIRRELPSRRLRPWLALIGMAGPSPMVIGSPTDDEPRFLEELERMVPSEAAMDLALAVRGVHSAIDQFHQQHGDALPIEVWLVTDGGRNGWQQAQGTAVHSLLDSLGERASIRILTVGQALLSHSNFSLRSLAIEGDLGVGQPVQIEAEIAHWNDDSKNKPSSLVEFLIDGEPQGRQSVACEAGQSIRVRIPWNPSRSGEHLIEVQLSEDALATDNRRWLSVTVREQRNVLIWEQVPGVGRYLQAALESLQVDSPSGTPSSPRLVDAGSWNVHRVAKDRIEEDDLSGMRAVLVCDVDIDDEQTVATLHRYFLRGGGLAFFLGPGVVADRYNRFFYPQAAKGDSSNLPEAIGLGPSNWLPAPLRAPAPLGVAGETGQYTIDPLGYRSRVVELFRDHPESGLLGLPIFRYWTLEPSPIPSRQIDLSIVAPTGRQEPLILHQTMADRTLYWILTHASPEEMPGGSWNAMAAWPSFVPLMASLVREAQQQESASNILVGQTISGVYDQPVPRADFRLEHQRYPAVERTWLSPDSSGSYLWSIPGPWRVGPYHLTSRPGLVDQGLAVNVDPMESDPARLDSAELEALIPAKAKSPEQATGTPLVPRELFRWFLLALLIALLAELPLRRWLRGSDERATWRSIWIPLRWASLALGLWMMSGPVRSRQAWELPELWFLVDRSGSMAHEDQGQSRWGLAAERIRSVQRLSESGPHARFQKRFFSVGERLQDWPRTLDLIQAQNIRPDQTRSLLGDCLRDALDLARGQHVAAIVLLSDGIVTEGLTLEEAGRLAHQARIPIHAATLGQDMLQPDLLVRDWNAEPTVFVGDRIQVQATIAQHDHRAREHAIVLRDSASNAVLDQKRVPFPPASQQEQVTLEFIALAPGSMRLQIEVPPMEMEANIANNRANFQIQVRDTSIPVLLVQRYPSYEFRFLKHLLERTRQIAHPDRKAFALTSVLEEGDNDYVEQDPSASKNFPVGLSELQAFDCVILGDVSPDILSGTNQRHLRDYVVRSGGGMIVMAGPLHMPQAYWESPFAKLLPIEPSARERSPARSGDLPGTPVLPGNTHLSRNQGPFRWRLTELGYQSTILRLRSTQEANQQLFASLPHQHWRLAGIRPHLLAQTLAVSDDEASPGPLLLTQFVGAGRVAFQATDESFQWQSFGGDDLNYQRYWNQLIRWVSRNHSLVERVPTELQLTKSLYRPAEPIWVQARVGWPDRETLIAPPQLRVRSSPKVDLLVPMEAQSEAGRFSARLPDLPPGGYTASLEPLGKDATFVVEAGAGESVALSPDHEQMKRLASVSGGEVVEPSQWLPFLNRIPLPAARFVPSGELVPSWNLPWVVSSMVALLSLEWILRRRQSLP